jgi:glutamate dehydrogenase
MTRTTEPTASSETHTAVAAAIATRPDLADVIAGYFRHVENHDQPRRARDVISMVEAHQKAGAVRRPGEVQIRSYNPRSGGDGWSGTSTVIDIVNDDMPYLVDTIVGTLTSAGITVHRVLHPILAVRRADNGDLVQIYGESVWGADPAGTVRESWMHLLVDRLTDAARMEQVEDELRSALQLVRIVVQDTAALTAMARQVAAELRGAFRPTPAGSEGADLLDWFAGGNMTFLGYRRRALGPGLATVFGPDGLGIWRPSVSSPGGDPAAVDGGAGVRGRAGFR